MPSIHRRPRSPYWHAAYTLPDGRRTLRSTGARNRKKAHAIALELEKASRAGRERRLTERKARDAISAIYSVANDEPLILYRVREFLEAWLRGKGLETKESTASEYRTTVAHLLKSLGAKAALSMDAITTKDARAFRDGLGHRLSATTANKHLKIARVIWGDAIALRAASENPFKAVKTLKTGPGTRKAFSEEQVRALLEVASRAWRGMIILGYYTGQRLGDLSRLTWQNVDVARGQVTLVTEKTGRHMTIPLAAPALRYLLSLKAPHNEREPLFAELSGRATETLSGQFSAIVASIGLGTYDKAKGSKGKGRGSRRATGGLTFHCLRHSCTSALKNAGASDVVAREIIGHDSEAVSRLYSHIETATLRRAVDSLPDILG